MSHIQTVTGPIEPGALGNTYIHEHVLCTAPESMQLSSGGDDVILDDEDLAAAELGLFAQAGGQSIVDLSCSEYGRDAAGLRRVSERTGVNIVCATGHIMEGYWLGVVDIAGRSDTELVDEMLNDLHSGVDGTDVKPGVIKVGTSRDRVAPDEERMIRAAVVAQRETGAPIFTHTSAGTMGVAQSEIFTDAGADMEHVLIGHLDRNLDWEEHLAIAKSGARLGYDCVSKEPYEPDAKRIEFIQRMVEHGYGDRICLSGDLARRSYQTSYGGGPGLTYILWRFVPWMRQVGVGDDVISRLLVGNPASVLTFTR